MDGAGARGLFHRHVTVRSGWEWELPRRPQDFAPGSVNTSIEAAMRWIAGGRIVTECLVELVRPEAAPEVYVDLAAARFDGLVAVFDWRRG